MQASSSHRTAWVARPEVDVTSIEPQLAAARDRGVAHLAQIADVEAPLLGIDRDLAFHYLRDNLHFTLGEQEFAGLERFARLCAHRGLVPKDAVRALTQMTTYGCTKQ
jgi:predicted solute-binding protein